MRFALNAPTRFAGWPRWAAILVLLLLSTVVLTSLPYERSSTNAARSVAGTSSNEGADLALYQRIVAKMRDGQGYYEAAAPELRERGFPVRPFVVFRMPTLAALLAWLPPGAPRALLFALVAAVLTVWGLRLKSVFERLPPAIIAILLISAGCAASLQQSLLPFHEVWAALLIALSIGLWREESCLPSVLAGLAAVMFRETALPYLLAMAGFALLDRRWRELLAWSAAIALFGVALAAHAVEVAAVTTAADPVSPGWAGLGGWPIFLSMTRLTTPLTLVPLAATALVVPLTLLGWMAWRTPVALRVLSILAGYALMFMLFARPDNFYWGLMIAPLLLLGLAFAPAALADLIQAARGKAPDLDRRAPAGP
jgi:hypothetical protein